MTKILILDDDRNRLMQFKQRLIGNIVSCVETVPEAIRRLSEEVFDVVFLDHDLDHKVNQPSGPGTGYEVAQWLNEHKSQMPAKIIIHSFNEEGAKNMLALLPKAFYIPGAWSKL